MNDEDILRNLVSGSPTRQSDWTAFLNRFSNLILKVIWLHERDYDEVMEKYLYVCRKLADNDLGRLRRFQLPNPGSREKASPAFTTWLAAVTQNLCIDAHRSRHGRKQLPRAISRLSESDREVFRLYYWKGYSIEEIEQHLGSGERTKAAVIEVIERIRDVFTGEQQKERGPLQIPFEEDDPRLQQAEESDLEEMRGWVTTWMASLSPQEQMIIRLRFWEDMSGPEIAQAMRISPQQKIYPLLQNALDSLRKAATNTYATRNPKQNIRVTRAKP